VSAAPSEERQESNSGAQLPESARLGDEDGLAEPTQPRVFEPHRARAVLKDRRASGDQRGIA
jgi:hypothetical protein